MSVLVNPKPSLEDLTGKQVVVKLKWGHECKGYLASMDKYMNLQVMYRNLFFDCFLFMSFFLFFLLSLRLCLMRLFYLFFMIYF